MPALRVAEYISATTDIWTIAATEPDMTLIFTVPIIPGHLATIMQEDVQMTEPHCCIRCSRAGWTHHPSYNAWNNKGQRASKAKFTSASTVCHHTLLFYSAKSMPIKIHTWGWLRL